MGALRRAFRVARVARARARRDRGYLGSMLPHVPSAPPTTWPARASTSEVIDLRTLRRWDHEAVVHSVRRTGRLVIVHEAWVGGDSAPKS